VILHRIWNEQQRLTYNSWAVQLRPTEVDVRYWRARAVEIHDVALEEYVDGIEPWLDDDPEEPDA